MFRLNAARCATQSLMRAPFSSTIVPQCRQFSAAAPLSPGEYPEKVNATGTRKSSVAQVWLKPGGTGQIVVNGKEFTEMWTEEHVQASIREPLVVCNLDETVDVMCVVKGGGFTGQAGAMRSGIAKAINKMDEAAFRPILRPAGMLTVDSRRVERKKPGQKKARKKFQWVKR